MTDVRPPRELAMLQGGVVARWQLIRAGLSERSAECWARGMQPLHDGVYLAGLAPPTQRQLWWAAVLSSPGTVLSHATAAASFGLRPVFGPVVTVTRVGNRGREHSPGLHVSYSLTLRNQVTDTTGSRLPPSSARSSICGHTCPRGPVRGFCAKGSVLAPRVRCSGWRRSARTAGGAGWLRCVSRSRSWQASGLNAAGRTPRRGRSLS